MKIRTSEVCAFVFIVMQSLLFGYTLNGCVKYTGVDSWIIPIIGSLLGFLLLLVYLYIFNYKKELNINELNIDLFKYGKVLNILLIIFVSFLAMALFWNLTNFVSSQYLYNTPQIFVELLFIGTVIYIIHNGVNSLFRTCLILAYILLFTSFINNTGLLKQINFKNLMPFFHSDFNIIKSCFVYITSAVCPIFLLLIIPRNKVMGKNLNKKIILTYIVTSLIIFFIIFLIISIFGINLVKLYQYPGYHILKRVFVGGITERMEKALAIYWVLTLFMGVIFSIYYVFKSLKDNFNFKKKSYVLIFIILYCSQYLFKNSTIAKYWIETGFPYVIGIFLIGIPLIIFIKIKKTKLIT